MYKNAVLYTILYSSGWGEGRERRKEKAFLLNKHMQKRRKKGEVESTTMPPPPPSAFSRIRVVLRIHKIEKRENKKLSFFACNVWGLFHALLVRSHVTLKETFLSHWKIWKLNFNKNFSKGTESEKKIRLTIWIDQGFFKKTATEHTNFPTEESLFSLHE